MNKKLLTKFKEQLIKEKITLLEELQLEKNLIACNEPGDIVDIAEKQISSDITNSISDLERIKLQEIEIALEKMKKGNYGICEGTGKLIPEARLSHIPWTKYSTEFAEMLEQEKAHKRI